MRDARRFSSKPERENGLLMKNGFAAIILGAGDVMGCSSGSTTKSRGNDGL